MPVTVLGESEASSRYYSFGTGSCSPTLRTLGPRSSQIQGPAGHSATCLDLLAPDCCAMWVRICTLAFGTVVSGVEDFASLLGGDRGFEFERSVNCLRVDSLSPCEATPHDLPAKGHPPPCVVTPKSIFVQPSSSLRRSIPAHSFGLQARSRR